MAAMGCAAINEFDQIWAEFKNNRVRSPLQNGRPIFFQQQRVGDHEAQKPLRLNGK